MTTKLVQKRFLKGVREFEITDDAVIARVKTLFKEERVTIGLSTLRPEPESSQSYLEFYGRDKSGPLLSFFINNPDPVEFNNFIDTLKRRVLLTFESFPGTHSAYPEGLAANIYDEPPDFEAFDRPRSEQNRSTVNPARIDEAIEMLEKFVTDDEIKPLLSALEALKAEPDNPVNFDNMETAFNNLGIVQGAVLTYAPYLSILLADDPMGN